MQQLSVRPRWLVLCALIVAALLLVSVSTGMALRNTSSNRFRGSGVAASGRNPCEPAGFGGSSFAGTRMADPTSAIASALKLSIGKLGQEVAAGRSLSQVISQAGLTSQQVSEAATAQQKDQLDQQVANGRLTLDQETAMLATFRSQIAAVLAGKTPLVAQSSQPGGFGRGGFNRPQNGQTGSNVCGG